MDPRVTRRSARLQEAHQRPAYLQVQTASSSQPQVQSQSPFNSSSSLASMSSVDTNSSQSPVMEQQSFRPDSAPMPSPTRSRMEQSNPFDAFYNPSQQPQQVQEQHMFQQMGQRNEQQYNSTARGSPETESFLSNLNLVAEAAKRAQMACLMRDFGDCGL